MSESVYRKKNLDALQSPDDLNDYIRVANPSVWIILIAVIVFLAGVCVWAAFGTIRTIVPVEATVQDNTAVCYMTWDDLESMEVGMTVEIGEVCGKVSEINVDEGYATLEIEIADGTYDASIITEILHPMSFLLN